MSKKYNTTIDFEFYDGTTCKMTLAFWEIYQLKNKNKSLYNRYNAAMANGGNKKSYDELEMLTILYVAYMCANMNKKDVLSEEEFIRKCGSDRIAVGKAVEGLTNPKKQQGFGNHSRTEHENLDQK